MMRPIFIILCLLLSIVLYRIGNSATWEQTASHSGWNVGINAGGISGPYGSSSTFGIGGGFRYGSTTQRITTIGAPIRTHYIRPIWNRHVYPRRVYPRARPGFHPVYVHPTWRPYRPVMRYYGSPFPRNSITITEPWVPASTKVVYTNVIQKPTVIVRNPPISTEEPILTYDEHGQPVITYGSPARIGNRVVIAETTALLKQQRVHQTEEIMAIERRIHKANKKLLEAQWDEKMKELDKRIEELNRSRD